MKICSKCEILKPNSKFNNHAAHSDGLRSACRECENSTFNADNKGVREYQLIVNYFLILDRIRGASYGQLAKKYNLDAANISKRVRGVLNATKTENPQVRNQI